MKKKIDIKILLVCILIPVFILLSNFVLLSMRDGDSSVSNKELIYDLALKSGYTKSYDNWYSENKEDVIVLRINETELQWIYSENISTNIWYTLIDVTEDNEFSTYEIWKILNTEKEEEEFYKLFNNTLYFMYEEYLLENTWYSGSYTEWCDDLLKGNLIIKQLYNVTFDLNGGTAIINIFQIYQEGSLISSVNSPTLKGYEFIGWYYKGELWNFSNNTVKENMTLTAQYKPIEYTISYHNLKDAYNNVLNVNSYNINSDTITLEDPYKEHYNFAGWYLEETYKTEITQINTKSYGNIDLYAGWEAKEYTVKYSMLNTSYDNKETFTIESTSLEFDLNLNDDSIKYEMYLDAEYNVEYNKDVSASTLINYLINDNVTIYIKVIEKTFETPEDGVVYQFGGMNWTLLEQNGSCYTLMLEESIKFTTQSTDSLAITNEILDVYNNIYLNFSNYEKEILLTNNTNTNHNLKYFDMYARNYLTHFANNYSFISTTTETSTTFENITKNGESVVIKAPINTTTEYNIVPIITIMLD
ncbi:MAG: InlB B-repeat-containing protein [bacterium]